jgi:hypothetical protein
LEIDQLFRKLPVTKSPFMKKFFSAFTFLVIALCTSAQNIDIAKHFKGLKPRSIGPAGMS